MVALVVLPSKAIHTPSEEKEGASASTPRVGIPPSTRVVRSTRYRLDPPERVLEKPIELDDTKTGNSSSDAAVTTGTTHVPSSWTSEMSRLPLPLVVKASQVTPASSSGQATQTSERHRRLPVQALFAQQASPSAPHGVLCPPPPEQASDNRTTEKACASARRRIGLLPGAGDVGP